MFLLKKMFLRGIFLISLLSLTFAKEKLVFVLTHFRHGARAPQNYYDKSNYLDYVLESWKRPGELTGIGQRMHYLLGLRNHERYIEKEHFLSSEFDPHEILIYSTRFNRTLLSAAAQLQGLYPPGTGEKLTTEHQKEWAVPLVHLSENILEEKSRLDNENVALPYQMTLAPIRMINDNDRKIIIYDIQKCIWRRDEMRKKNENLESMKNIVNEFNNKYAENLKSMFENKTEYDIHFIDNFCDAFIAGYTEGKELYNVRDTNINLTELLDYCYEFSKLNFRDWISGDEDRTLSTLEVSKFMREFIYYMNQRVEADIKGEDISAKLEDYSRPKMMMISGHDSTISAYEMFLGKIFGNNDAINFYRYPKFATQIAFEIVTEEDKQDKTRDDYIFNYYFNDEKVLSMKIDEFINQVTPQLWTDEQINKYCGFDKDTDQQTDESADSDDNKTDQSENTDQVPDSTSDDRRSDESDDSTDKNTDSTSDERTDESDAGTDKDTDSTSDESTDKSKEEIEKERNLYFTLMIVFSCLSGVFLILIIVLILKARKKTSELIDKPGSLLMSSE